MLSLVLGQRSQAGAKTAKVIHEYIQTHQGQQGSEITPAELKEPVCSHSGHIFDDVEQLLCTLQTDKRAGCNQLWFVSVNLPRFRKGWASYLWCLAKVDGTQSQTLTPGLVHTHTCRHTEEPSECKTLKDAEEEDAGSVTSVVVK